MPKETKVISSKVTCKSIRKSSQESGIITRNQRREKDQQWMAHEKRILLLRSTCLNYFDALIIIN